jgi:hypothetical protein
MKMEEEAGPFFPTVSLVRRPVGLCPMLGDVLSDMFNALKSQRNLAVQAYMVPPTRRNANIDKLIPDGGKLLADMPWHLRRSTITRAAIGAFWQSFVYRGWSQMTCCDSKNQARMMACAPMGFRAGLAMAHPCRSIFCPHCHMRSALALFDKVSELQPWGSEVEALVVREEIPFRDTMSGYEPSGETDILRHVKACLDSRECLGVRTTGASMLDSVPSNVNCYLVLVHRDRLQAVRRRLGRMRLSLQKAGRDVTVRTAVDLADGVRKAMDCSPVVLTASRHLLESSVTVHCLDKYRESLHNRRRIFLITDPRKVRATDVASEAPVATLAEEPLEAAFRETGE